MGARVVACPQCGKNVVWDPANRWRPFCSERCRLVDLNRWFKGSYSVGRPLQATEEDTGP